MWIGSSLTISISRILVQAPMLPTRGAIRETAIRRVFNRKEDSPGMNERNKFTPSGIPGEGLTVTSKS
jgi:hypothetical protein